jgi:hypothetical protein
MKKKQLVRSHVERCLHEIWHTPALVHDSDRDYPFRSETAACWVRVDTSVKPWVVNVFAHAACGVDGTVKVLREVNEVSGRARVVTVLWYGGCVLVRQVMPADAVGVRSLRQALYSVSSVADEIGPMFAAMFDGSTPFAAEEANHAS